jgi:hypothetical protein
MQLYNMYIHTSGRPIRSWQEWHYIFTVIFNSVYIDHINLSLLHHLISSLSAGLVCRPGAFPVEEELGFQREG